MVWGAAKEWTYGTMVHIMHKLETSWLHGTHHVWPSGSHVSINWVCSPAYSFGTSVSTQGAEWICVCVCECVRTRSRSSKMTFQEIQQEKSPVHVNLDFPPDKFSRFIKRTCCCWIVWISFFTAVRTMSNPGKIIPKQSKFRYHDMESGRKKKFFRNLVVNQSFMVSR